MLELFPNGKFSISYYIPLCTIFHFHSPQFPIITILHNSCFPSAQFSTYFHSAQYHISCFHLLFLISILLNYFLFPFYILPIRGSNIDDMIYIMYNMRIVLLLNPVLNPHLLLICVLGKKYKRVKLCRVRLRYSCRHLAIINLLWERCYDGRSHCVPVTSSCITK